MIDGLLDASGCAGVKLLVFGIGETYNAHLRTTETTIVWRAYRASFEAPRRWTFGKIAIFAAPAPVDYRRSSWIAKRSGRRGRYATLGASEVDTDFVGGLVRNPARFHRVFLVVCFVVASVAPAAAMQTQLYESATPDNIFTPIPGASITRSPSFTGVLPVGSIASGVTTGLSIPVTTQTRLLMVYYINTAGGSVALFSGFASGGVGIN